jgi:hypothetical protein
LDPRERFNFRLALALGRTVRELLEGIDSVELAKWQIYYSIEPFGELRADYRQAITSWLLACVHRKRGANPPRLEDFLTVPRQPKVQTVGEMKGVLKRVVDMFKTKNKKGT